MEARDALTVSPMGTSLGNLARNFDSMAANALSMRVCLEGLAADATS